jgi:N-acetylmuramoyl-L-alanine amidase
MPLVPLDFPDRLRARGLTTNIEGGWETRGSSADHAAVVLHWTASSASESPQSCANYCCYQAENAPDYGVLCDRYGAVWVLAREKANSSGKISGTALNEALRGEARLGVSAASRGLSDTTSANERLWSISAQNSGVGEHYSPALVNAMAVTAAVSLECLGLGHAGYVTEHSSLTARKIDLVEGWGRYGLCSAGEFVDRVNDALTGEAEMPLNDVDLEHIRRIVLDVVRSEGVSGAADGHASSVPEVVNGYTRDVVLDIVRKEGISGCDAHVMADVVPRLDDIADAVGVPEDTRRRRGDDT